MQIRDGVTFKYPSEIEIGDYCKIGENCFFVGKGGLWIGNHVLIGAGTKIITSEHQSEDLEMPIGMQGLAFNSVIIEDNVWFGFDVKVLSGTFIGQGAIIGTSAVVRHGNIPKRAVAVGIPARVVKYRGEEVPLPPQ